MPILQVLCDGNHTEFNVTIPADINSTHFHLKSVHVRLSAPADATTHTMQIFLPFLRHMYEVNSTTGRAAIVVPLSSDLKMSEFYPDVVLVNENIQRNILVQLMDSVTGALWEDGGGATIEFVLLTFEYVE